MAFPIIRVNSAIGSDTAASGAGPDVAITGTDGYAHGSLMLKDYTGSLSGIPTDGSAALFVNTAVAGKRNHFAISGVQNTRLIWNNRAWSSTTQTITGADFSSLSVGEFVILVGAGTGGVDLVVQVNLADTNMLQFYPPTVTAQANSSVIRPKSISISNGDFAGYGDAVGPYSWAVGGRRASIGSATSRKLFENNAAAGDAFPGWIIELEDGHVETLPTSGIWWRRSGDTANGRLTLRGAAGAVIRPKLVFTHATNIAWNTGGYSYLLFADFDLERNVNGAAGGTAFNTVGSYTMVRRVKITSIGTSNWSSGIIGGTGTVAINNYIEKCTFGIVVANALFNYLKGCGTGISATNNAETREIIGNIIHNPTTLGISIANYSYYKNVQFNTVYADTGTPNGISFDASASGTKYNCFFINNLVYGCVTAFPVVGTSPENAAGLLARNVIYDGNCVHNCTNLVTAGYATLLTNTVTADPQFADPANGDFSVGTNLKAMGFPTTTIGLSNTRSYVDIGAAQRQEAGSGGRRGGYNEGYAT